MPTQQNTSQKTLYAIAAAIIILGIALLWWSMHSSASNVLPIASGDDIESWDFEGPYESNEDLATKARADIERFEGMLGNHGTSTTDYELYVSIANQHMQLGEGKAAYENLEKAVEIDPDHTGLGWHNLGQLMVRLGALNTARTAYAKAAEAQPEVEQYHVARLTFLTRYFEDDTSAIEGAFNDAEAELGADAPVLQVRAAWEESRGNIQGAIDALNAMKPLVPNHADIDSEIARLEAEL